MFHGAPTARLTTLAPRASLRRPYSTSVRARHTRHGAGRALGRHSPPKRSVPLLGIHAPCPCVNDKSRAIRTAVIPAAGKGTRMLPTTSAVPKELLPVLGIPALQWILDESIAAGVEHVVLISSKEKTQLETYITNADATAVLLERQGRSSLATRLAAVSRLDIEVVYQNEPKGLGHAVATAEKAVAGEPFYVLLPDEIFTDATTLHAISATATATSLTSVALRNAPANQIHRHGIADTTGRFMAPTAWGAPRPFQVSRFTHVAEKPAPSRAPSTATIVGRYGLTSKIFAALREVQPGTAGEIPLTDAIAILAASESAYGVFTSTPRFDIGASEDIALATVQLALADETLGDAVRQILEAARPTIGDY